MMLKLIYQLCANKTGSTSMQFAMIFGVAAIASALAVPFLFEKNSTQYAYSDRNVDRVVTGAVGQKRFYTIRKSVLDSQ